MIIGTATTADIYRAMHPKLKEIATNLEAKTKLALESVKHVDRVSFRVKDPASFEKKCQKQNDKGEPKYERPLEEIEDHIGGRILVLFRRDIPIVVEKLRMVFNAVEHQQKAPDGYDRFAYESTHLIATIPIDVVAPEWVNLKERPRMFEIQVRTLFMHAWAELEHDITYKPSTSITHDMRREIAWAASSAWGCDSIFDRIIGEVETK